MVITRQGASRRMAGHQADAFLAVQAHVVAELLVRQRLDGRGVDDVALLAERFFDDPVGDDRLAGSGGGGDEHTGAASQVPDGGRLEAIERETPVFHRVSVLGGGGVARDPDPLR